MDSLEQIEAFASDELPPESSGEVRIFLRRLGDGAGKSDAAGMRSVALDRTRPVVDQVCDHLERLGAKSGRYELRFRLGTQNLRQFTCTLELAPPSSKPSSTSSSALDGPATGQKTLNDLATEIGQVFLRKKLQRAFALDEDDEDLDDVDEDDEDGDDEDEQGTAKDKIGKLAYELIASEPVQNSVKQLGGLLEDWIGAKVMKVKLDHVEREEAEQKKKAAAETLGGSSTTTPATSGNTATPAKQPQKVRVIRIVSEEQAKKKAGAGE